MNKGVGQCCWFVLGAVLLLAVSASRAGAQSADRVLGPVNPSQVVALEGHHPSWAQPQADVGAVPAELHLQHLTLILARSPQEQQAFEQFLRNQQNPASGDYHHWLTPREVGERFGVSPHDLAAITAWLQSQNLRVDSVADSRVRINFSGVASAVGNAFGGEMHYFLRNGKKRISLAAPPRIPAALAPVIQAIHGLYSVETRPMVKSTVHHFAAKGARPAVYTSGGNFIGPGDFAVIYDVPANPTGANQTIAIIGRSRVDNADIENFQSLFGLATQDPTVIIPPDGIDPGPPQTFPPGDSILSSDQEEATVDVSRAGSIAPGATIDLVISASSFTTDGIAIAASYAVDTTPLLAHIMSLSFGDCEGNEGPSGVAFWDNLFSQAAAEGISVFVASGDAGAAGCDIAFQTPPATQVLSTNFICSSSYATCVGGTEFNDAADPNLYWSQNNGSTGETALSYIPEGAWNEPTTTNPNNPYEAASSGGGMSAYISTPYWQTGPGVPAARSGRYTPDLAFSSADHDGYVGCFTAAGGDCISFFVVFFGTSVAAQDMAGIAALLNQKLGAPQGNLNPTLYKLAASANNVFHDVTLASSGVSPCDINTPSMCNNSTPGPTTLTGGLPGYLVGTGYDEATGLGSLDVANFLAGWTTASVNISSTATTLATSANPVVAGATITLTAAVTTTGPNPPTGNVAFLDASTTLQTVALNPSGVATFTTSSLSLGQHSITAVYAGDNNNPGSTSSALSQTILAGNPVPMLISLTPSSASAGGGTFVLTLTGSNFMPNSQVFWNGNNRATTYVSGGTQLQASITAADLARAGSATVTVSNPAPSGGTSNPLTFDVLETFAGSGGYLSMFVNGAGLGNSALFQSNGFIGVGTTSPGALLDVEFTTATPTNALLSNINYNNSTAVTNAVVSAFDMNFMDNSTAANLSKQTARIAYIREAGATGGVTAFDTALTTTEVVNSNAPFPVRSINIEGPNMATGTSLSFFTGLYIGSPSGTGTVVNKYALVTEPNAGNVGIGTTSPATPLQVFGDIRVGTSGTNGCLQNFSGTGIMGTCSSDARLKTNILPFAPVLDKLVKLQPVHFDWNAEQYPDYHFGPGRNSGLLAQDVEKVFPELVSADAHGFKMVNYSELPYLTLAAIRELKTENDSLRAQLAALEARLARLERPPSRGARKRTNVQLKPAAGAKADTTGAR